MKTSSSSLFIVSFLTAAFAFDAAPLPAAEDAAEEGWIALFDGEDLDGWMSAGGGEPGEGWKVADGTMKLDGKGGDIWTKDRYGDFILELDYNTEGNSGVFIRTDNPRDNVQTGLEIQVNKPGGPNRNSVGAVYDAAAPSKNAAVEGWNKMVITAKGSMLKVELNGEEIVEIDLDEWTEAGKNPDGSKNKFRTALKDFKREGHIGFQDHGAGVAYRNVRLKPIES